MWHSLIITSTLFLHLTYTHQSVSFIKKIVNQLIKKNFCQILVLFDFLSWFQVLDYRMIAFLLAIGFSKY